MGAWRAGWAVAVALVAGVPAGAGAQLLADAGAWTLAGDAEFGTVDGRRALSLRAGSADHGALVLADGTISFAMKVTGARTFVGLRLRLGPDGTYEDIYFRPHKSGMPDAIQYNPAFRGRGQWQLHHGPDATAFVDYRPGEWQRVRVVLEGTRAAVFVGDDAEPDLVVPRLRTGRTEGGFGFWASRPGAQPTDPWTVSITDLTVEPGAAGWSFPADEAEVREAGVIERWEIRAAGSGDAAALEAVPEGGAGPWTTVESAASGLVSLQRHLPPAESGPSLALARVRLRSDRAHTVRLDLGFSDDVTVFLDGRPLYSGRFGYSYNFPRRDGLISLDQATVHLPLEAGEHEVVVAVSDVFGGWGLMGRIVDRDGVTVVRP